MAEDKDKLENELKEWWDENMSHGAFALTKDDIDFYDRPKNKEQCV